MPDQPQADESLPNPTPDETARLMREGSHCKVPWWKRLLPPWVFSIGLHLFVLPFVLGITVVFADSLFVSSVWNDARAEEQGDDLPSNLLVDRDLPVEDVQEKVVPLIKATESALKQPATQSPDPSSRPVPTTPETEPMGLAGGTVFQGTVVRADRKRITVALPDGTQRTVSFGSPIEGVAQAIPQGCSVSIAVDFKQGEVHFRSLSVLSRPPESETCGTVIGVNGTHITVQLAGGAERFFSWDENTRVAYSSITRGFDSRGGDITAIPSNAPVRVLSYAKDGKDYARAVFWLD